MITRVVGEFETEQCISNAMCSVAKRVGVGESLIFRIPTRPGRLDRVKAKARAVVAGSTDLIWRRLVVRRPTLGYEDTRRFSLRQGSADSLGKERSRLVLGKERWVKVRDIFAAIYQQMHYP
eukprot:7185159-Lingulodinium_polyedra.AAC.1